MTSLFSKPRLDVLVLNREYRQNNCYISQIANMLEDVFSVHYHYLREIRAKPFFFSLKSQFVLSLLQIRILKQYIEEVRRFVNHAPVVIYDQDPWESFIDEGTTLGSYEALTSKLNIRRFFVTSIWWSNFLDSRGFNSQFIQMGISSNFLPTELDLEKRRHELLFQGTLHPYRASFFKECKSIGLDVTVLESTSYSTYLSNLREASFHIHVGHPKWSIGNSFHDPNCCWIKDLEAVSQGCISLRNFETEYHSLELHKIPAIATWKTIDEIPEIIDEIKRDPQLHRQKVSESVNIIKNSFNWKQMGECLAKLMD